MLYKKMNFFKLKYKTIDVNKNLEELNEINKDKIRIFGDKFIKRNMYKYKIIYKNKEYNLKEYFEDIEKIIIIMT